MVKTQVKIKGLNVKIALKVFKDAISKKFIWRHFIERKETLADYLLGFKWRLDNGYTIKAIVADG